MLPPPIDGSSDHLVCKAPRIVLHPELRCWLAQFERTFAGNPCQRLHAERRPEVPWDAPGRERSRINDGTLTQWT